MNGLGARVGIVGSLAFVWSCATPAPGRPAATSAPASVAEVHPPPFSPPEVSPGADPRTDLRSAIFDAAWRAVRDKHFDRTLGGLDWQAMRSKYEPLALGAPNQTAFYRTMNDMLAEIGQSHMSITGPGDEGEGIDEGRQETGIAVSDGDPGLTVRVIEGRPTVSSVRSGSPADRAGLRPGFIVTHIGGRPLEATVSTRRALRPVEERFQVRAAAARRLAGAAGTQVTVRVLDLENRPSEVMLERAAPAAPPVQVGFLPPLYPEVRVSQVGEVGIISFNLFWLEPVLGQVQKAIDGCRARGARGLVIDLRGNPGGVGAMTIPIAARLVTEPLVLGTLQFRDHSNTLRAVPETGVAAFTGPVAVVTDEATASASEMLAAGLQEAGRAVVVGDPTLGAVLPSVIEKLPGGAILQLAIADFRTPKGVLLEGRGVQPNRRVEVTRDALRKSRDPVLDEAVAQVRASRR